MQYFSGPVFFLNMKNGATETDSYNYLYQKQKTTKKYAFTFSDGRQKKCKNFHKYLRAKNKASVLH